MVENAEAILAQDKLPDEVEDYDAFAEFEGDILGPLGDEEDE